MLTAAVLVVALLACYVTWTAGRLDRMHARVDAAWSALDAQLVRRAAAARALVAHLPPGPQTTALERATAAALEAGPVGRETVENDLSRALRAALPTLPPAHVDSGDPVPRLREELDAASARVGLARSFHNTAVRDTRVLRRRRVPRALHLAGHREMPTWFDIDDTVLPAGREATR